MQAYTTIAATEVIRDRVNAIREARSSRLGRRVSSAEVLEDVLDFYESNHQEGNDEQG